jgi:hypothetical protein
MLHFNTKNSDKKMSLGVQAIQLKKLIYTRDELKRKAILTNLENDWLNYKTTRNK